MLVNQDRIARGSPLEPTESVALLVMSGGVSAASNFTVQPLCCPPCGAGFRAPPSEHAPLTFGCGHTVCAACAEAVGLCDRPSCPICYAYCDERGHAVPNMELAAFAEAMALWSLQNGM